MRGKTVLTTASAVTLGLGLLMPFRPTVVLGHSMAPTMRSGSVHMINTWYYRNHPIRVDDVIVFRHKGETCTKRVHALPGQKVLLLEDTEGGADELLDEHEAAVLGELERHGRLRGRHIKVLTVPPGHLFVLGDNRSVSWDSREFGCLPVRTILGRVAM
jgi:signal peptidase I